MHKNSEVGQTTEKARKVRLLSPKQAKAALERRGQSVAEWARQHDVDLATTYQVLDGKKKGKRGEAHKIAVLLGIKDGEIPAAQAGA